MSFDLILFPRKGRRLERGKFCAYFEKQRHVERTDDEVRYSNDDTGVYFTLSYKERDVADPEERARAELAKTTIAFEMNFVRPGFFALEASLVLSRLAEHFSLLVEDPQKDGMQRVAFDADAFVKNWTGSNRWACQAIGQTGGSSHLTLPPALNEALWRWNYSQDTMSRRFEDDLIGAFVPLVKFYREGDQARSFCIFPNLVPTAVPKVDRVMITRDKLPPPHARKSNPTPAWVTWDEIVAVMPGYEIRGEGVGRDGHPHLILFDEDGYQSPKTAPNALALWVIGLPDWPGRPDIISPDQILDAEVTGPAGGA